MQSARDLLLAKFALKTGLVSAEVLHDCVREQQQRGQGATLLQVLVRRRLVTAESLVPINQAIEATSFDCLRCRVRHAFRTIASTALACPTCRGPLTIVREDGETISERLQTGRGIGSQRFSTRVDSKTPRDLRSTVGGSGSAEQPLKTFGPYEIIAEVGRGGMGVVYKARHPGLDRVVALKVLIAGNMASKTQVKRFEREAALAGKLKHPAIVSIHDAGTIDDRHYFTMDFIEGIALSDRVKARDLPLRHGVEIARDLARALAHAHANGVIHRDVKPANVILDAEGRPHLTDFGLAREADAEDSARLTREGATVGTPFYMSPEQARGDAKAVGPSTDIYSLGVVLFEMLTFEHPFKAQGQIELTRKILSEPPPRPTDLEPAIDPDVEAIVLKVLEKDPKERYTTADLFADELDRYLRGEPVQARVRRLSLARTRMVAYALCALLGAVGLGLGAWGLYQLHLHNLAEEKAAAEKSQAEAAAREAARKREAAAQALKEAETAFNDADRVPFATAGGAFAEKLRTAIDRSSECIKLDPACARAFLLRGRAEEILCKRDACGQDYAQARKLEPQGTSGLEAAYREIILDLRWKGPSDATLERLAKLSEGPGPPLWRTLARAARLLALRDAEVERALSELEAAKRLDSACSEVYHLIAIAHTSEPSEEHLKNALEALNSCLQADPKNARAFSLRARVRTALGQIDQAEEDVRSALAIDADEPAALIVRVQLDAEKGNFGLAADSVHRILASQAGHEDVALLLEAIEVFARANDVASAQQAAERAAQLAPGRPESYIALANALLPQNTQAAAAALRNGIEHCPDERAQNHLAGLYVELLAGEGAIDDALAFAEGHLEQAKGDPSRQLRVATLHAMRRQPGDEDAALALLDQIHGPAPALVEAYHTRFKILIDLGRTKELDEAVEALQRAAPLEPLAWACIARLYAVTDRPRQALEAARKGVDVDPQSPEANAQLAEIYYTADDLRNAALYAQAALRRDPRNAHALTILAGSSLKSKGPNSDAARWLEAALQSDPSNADAGYFLAGLFYADGKLDLAARVAQSVLARRNGDDGRLLGLLGVAELGLGQLELAEKALRRAVAIESGNAKFHAALGEVLFRKGQKADARAEIDDALRIDPGCVEAKRTLEQLRR